MNNTRGIILLGLMLLCTVWARAQQVDVEELSKLREKKLFGLNGGISAASTYFHSNEMNGRQPFVWQLQGNLNASILELIDIPLSMHLNNFGSQLSYPSLPNRLSLHPSYKWAKAHIGDVAMSFSPYTLNGHLFTGGGVELTPGKWSVAAMGGRMMRRVSYDPQRPSIPPSFNRYGYGAKVRRDGNQFFVGGSFFTAQDRVNETSFQSDSLHIYPRSNLAVSIEAGVTLLRNLRLSGEYAVSLLTRDMRSSGMGDRTFDRWIHRKESTSTYDAMHFALDYTFKKNAIGLGYERISPQYETLGAYYFNNDYENITLNYARPFLQDKANVAVSGGLQRDDLDGSKESKNSRFVGSIHLSYAPSETLNLGLSTSTFQGYRVIKSQFDYINQTTPYENLDTLNFRQISQNVDFNLGWMLSQGAKTNQNLSFFASYQEAADKQGRYILPGNLSRILNASSVYSLEVIAIRTNFNLGVNVSNNYSNQANFFTFGPVAGVSMKLLRKKLTTGVTASYNRSLNDSTPMAKVFNGRWNVNYRLFKKHSLVADLIFQQRHFMTQTPVRKVNSLTAQAGYSYNF